MFNKHLAVGGRQVQKDYDSHFQQNWFFLEVRIGLVFFISGRQLDFKYHHENLYIYT